MRALAADAGVIIRLDSINRQEILAEDPGLDHRAGLAVGGLKGGNEDNGRPIECRWTSPQFQATTLG